MNPPDNRRQLSIPLLSSLLLNALLIGVLATHWLHAGRDRSDGHRLPAGLPSIHGLARELGEDARADLRRQLAGNRDSIRGAMRDARESRHGVVMAMTAQPFDGDALASAFATQRQADMAVAAAIQAVLVEFARAHDAADREALLRAMSREHRERGKPRGSREPGRHPAPADDPRPGDNR